MDENPDENQLTIEEQIRLELCGIEAVIEAVGESPPLFVQVRDRLISLLDQLCRNEVQTEYAEVQLEHIQVILNRWLRDNPIPPDVGNGS